MKTQTFVSAKETDRLAQTTHDAVPIFNRASTASSLVRQAVRSHGQPLDSSTRETMQARFGHDFSRVRVHTDTTAAQSATALSAAAYTVGDDIVFSQGQYAPTSAWGNHLLAHELTHVIQQTPQPASAGPLKIESAESSSEIEAQRASAHVAAGRESGPVQTRHHAPTLSRSLLGAGVGGGIGAVVGGVAGALLGSLLGPGGAVVGGLLGGLGGLVAGALIGDAVSSDSRHLKPEEKSYAHDIYLESIDYDAITIKKGAAAAAGATRTTGNTINLQSGYFDGNTMNLTPKGMLVLIHEMGHVWQYQNGGLGYISSSLIMQGAASSQGLSRNAAYNWKNAIDSRIPWERWSAEQQAECISDYNEALRKVNAGNGELEDFHVVALAEPYIELVRKRFGAVGSTPPPAPADPAKP